MIIANGATSKLFVSDYNRQNSELQTSMGKLASGERMITPGEAPADLGISERFRAQIRNSDEAGRVIQNGVNLFSSSDAWLQQVQNILDRMSELAISASDGSKNSGDRENLDLEFQQLKSEVSRISEAGKYNGLQVNGNTSAAVYDFTKNTIVYSQGDGSDIRELGINMKNGNQSQNGLQYNLVNSTTNSNGEFVGDFLFSNDGKSLIYIDAVNFDRVMKLDIESDTITRTAALTAAGAAFDQEMQLMMDDKGRVWVAQAADGSTATGQGGFTISLLDEESMTLDSGGTASSAWAGGVTTGSGFAEVAIHGDAIYYMQKSTKIETDPVLANAVGGTSESNLAIDLTSTVSADDFTVTWTPTGPLALTTERPGSQVQLATKFSVTTSATGVIDLDDLILASDWPVGFDPTSQADLNIFDGFEVLQTVAGPITYDSNTHEIAGLANSAPYNLYFKGTETGNSVVFDPAAPPAPEANTARSITYRQTYNLVKQNLFDTSEQEVLVTDVKPFNSSNYAVTDSSPELHLTGYSLSKDGQYLAWESADGDISVMKTDTAETSTISVGTNSTANQNTVNALGFDSNNKLYWTNTGGSSNQNAINRISIGSGSKPSLGEVEIVRSDVAGTMGTTSYAAASDMTQQGRGLSLMGGSPSSNYTFQIGPDSGMAVAFSTANVELVTLGISSLDILSTSGAEGSIEALSNALNTVSNQRAVIGSQVSRLGFIFDANDAYSNNIGQAESRIRDVDFASESAKLAKAQVMAQTSTAILSQMNLSQQSVLRLLQ